MSTQAVYVYILHVPTIAVEAMKELCAGLEEEGVPYVLEQASGPDDGIILAAQAAASSPLQVGIGIDQMGHVYVQHEQLHQKIPYLHGTLQHGRTAGKNAARLVKGLKLIV